VREKCGISKKLVGMEHPEEVIKKAEVHNKFVIKNHSSTRLNRSFAKLKTANDKEFNLFVEANLKTIPE
jgi:hypothetical protein